MHGKTMMVAGTALLMAAGPGEAIHAGTAKYSAPINVATGTVTIRATATFSDGSSADRLYKVTLDADSDGDGAGDEVWLRVACAGGAVTSAHTVKSPRDSASGMASGKRQHKPFTIVKEWDRTAIVGQRVSWDLKQANGARAAAKDGKTMSADDWHQRTLRDGAANLCV